MGPGEGNVAQRQTGFKEKPCTKAANAADDGWWRWMIDARGADLLPTHFFTRPHCGQQIRTGLEVDSHTAVEPGLTTSRDIGLSCCKKGRAQPKGEAGVEPKHL